MIKRIFVYLLLIMAVGIFQGFLYSVSKPGDQEDVNYRDVFILGNYAYCTASGKGLDILDIGDPLSPKKIGNIDTTGSADSVYVADNYAYVADIEEGLKIIDVSNPVSPVLVGNYNTSPSGWANRVFVMGNYAYMADGGFKVIDISDPSSPLKVGEIPSSQYGFIFDVWVQGAYAYLLCKDDWLDCWLLAIDISSPSSPALAGYLFEDDYPDFYNLRRLYVKGNYAYVSGEGGAHVIDISNPASPAASGIYKGFDLFGGGGIFVAGSFAYMAHTVYNQDRQEVEGYLRVLDISNPVSPAPTASYDIPGRPLDVSVKGHYAYVVDGTGDTLRVVDLDPSHVSPVIGLDKSRLNFVTVLPDITPGTQALRVNNTGGGTLNWTASVDRDGLVCFPSSGTAGGEVLVSVDTSGLTPGSYFANLAVSDPNAGNSPQTVWITLTVYASGQTGGPFGVFSTPTDGAAVSGSIPVTGWALDDVGVQSVKIFREEDGSLVYIGDAVFVEGARPDVERLYPWTPMNYRAGWGYMMLTNFLPDGGNGTFTLHVIATDFEGNPVTLGTRTITVNNADAVKPFGAIDTPAQGGTTSGAGYRNQGWVLTPSPNKIPEDGSTINVYINGVLLGHPTYNIYREDIASLFPGYGNSDGALAYFDFDTAAYTNGVHTIQWTAGDDGGNIEGIGSRYFTIQNSTQNRDSSSSLVPLRPEIIPVDYFNPVGVLKGYRDDIKPLDVYPRDNGIVTVEIKELQRVALHMEQENILSSFYSGYLSVGEKLRPLPIGSTLDRKRGVFYWQPGPGFMGNFHFVFIGKERRGTMKRKDVCISIVPEFLSRKREK